MAGSNVNIHNRHYRDDQGDHSEKDGRNKTGWPRHYRHDLKDHENGSEGDVHIVEENETSNGQDRGLMPTEQYPVGRVKVKRFNDRRPMRDGAHVHQRHSRPSCDTLMSEPKGTSIIV